MLFLVALRTLAKEIILIGLFFIKSKEILNNILKKNLFIIITEFLV